MGSCLGHCRLARDSFSLYKFYSKTRDSVDIQISGLANTESEEHIIGGDSPTLHDRNDFSTDRKLEVEPKVSNFRRNKSHDSSALRLELLDDEWSINEADYSARTESLAIPSSAKMKEEKSQYSASVNSLDLQWEHLPEMTVFSTNLDKEEPKSATSVGDWSRLSSADSLEWDPIDVDLKEEVDTETEQLLQEIEMLSSKTLQETQEWAS